MDYDRNHNYKKGLECLDNKTYRCCHALNSSNQLPQILHRYEDSGTIAFSIITNIGPYMLKLRIGQQQKHHLKFFINYSRVNKAPLFLRQDRFI